VARETRRQRRDARRAAGDGAAPRTRPGQPLPATGVETVEPNRSQVIQGTVVVLVCCAVIGAFLWGADQALRPFVREILLGQ
jgi:preprotein translocase SecE subunit